MRSRGRLRCAGCYAEGLRGCSDSLSLEHYVSGSALKLTADEDGMVSTEGFAWLSEGERRSVPAHKFGARILCRAHNSALEPLDRVGARFFDPIVNVGAFFRENPNAGQDRRVLVSGHDVERWFLKVLIGAAFGVMRETKEAWRPPKAWLRILYGVDPRFPDGHGLALEAVPGSTAPIRRNMGFAPLFENGELAGLLAELAGMRFRLFMTERGRKASVYRPGSIVWTAPSGVRQVLFLGWERPDGERRVDLEWGEIPET